MRRQRFTHVSLVEALVVGVIAIAVIGVTLTTRLGTGGPIALGATASPLASPETEASPAVGEVIALPSSESGDLTLIRADQPPAFSQREAMQVVHDFGVAVALGGERFGKPATVSATNGSGTLGRSGGPGLPWLGLRNVPQKGTDVILGHVENRPMWILDYDNAYAPAPACPGCDSLVFKHAVYAIDDETRSVLIVWFYDQVPSSEVPETPTT